MKIQFIWIDKTKQGPEKDIIEKYLKRIRRFASAEIVELKPAKKSDNPNQIMNGEAKEIEKHIIPGSFIIATSPEGKEIDSHKFSALLERELKNHSGNISILIGGRHGLSEDLISRCHSRLSISKMTLNHYLVRIFLLEQVYRAFCILHNFPYAK